MSKKKHDPVFEIEATFREEDELAQLKSSDDVAKLRSMLNEDEVVYRLVSCFHHQSDGVLAATNQRVIFADKRFLSSLVVSYEYSEIAAIITSPELVTREITIAHLTDSLTLNHVDKEHGLRFVKFAADLIGDDYAAQGKNKRLLEHRNHKLNDSDLSE